MAQSIKPEKTRALDERFHREIAAQAKYARRLGETVELPSRDESTLEQWRIVDVIRGDDHAPVMLRSADGKRMMTIPALRLERYETAVQGHRATENTPLVVPVADIPDEPRETMKERFARRYAMVDYSDSVEQTASDDAEEALHREKAELKGVSGFVAKMLKHNIGYEITRQLELNRARTKIVSEKNIYANKGGTRAEHRAAIGAVMDRFLAEHEEFLHQEGKDGERRKEFGNTPAELQVKRELNALVRELAANPEMTEEEVDARRARVFKDARELAGEAKGRGLMYADNLRAIAEEVRMAALHAGGLDNLDLDIDFAIGKAKLGARTEREKNLVDSALEKLERWGKDKHVVGGILSAFRNELAVAVASTVAIGNILGRTALSSTAANLMTFGGAGAITGLYSWWREKGKLNRERSLHERQMALGGDVNTELSQEQLDDLATRRAELTKQYQDTPLWRPLRRYELKKELDELYASEKPRRDEMQKFAMARANAKDLAYGGIGFLTPENTLRPDADPAIVMKALAEMEARVRISNAEKVDLLRYSSPMQAEVERRNLDATRMALKAALRAAVPGFQEEYNRILAETTTEFYGNEESGVRKTNEKFATYAQNRARKVGLQTALIGAGIGYVAHEIWALASDNETVTGSIGRFASWLKGYISGDTPLLPAGSPNVERIADGVFTTPNGTHLVPQADGSFAIETIADHKVIASGLFIGSDGTFDAASAETLRKLGASLVEADTFTTHSEIVTERVATWDWLHEHAPDVNQIKRDIWFGNDTPSPVFDFNEQGLDWGKVAGVNADGDFVMDMSSMTSDGSWQGIEEVDALAEMANGKLRLVLTMNESSQNHAVEILFDEHGQAIIPADSDIARTFFAVKDGKAVFLGKYAEVAVSRGFDEKGVHHLGILATHIGKGLKEGVLTREIGECIPEHVTHITLPHSQPPTLIMPPILPLRPRTPLERLHKAGKSMGGDELAETQIDPHTGMDVTGYFMGSVESAGGSGGQEALLKKLIETKDDGRELPEKVPYYKLVADTEMLGVMLARNRSETLKKNPHAKLNQYKEAQEYLAKLPETYRNEVRRLAQQAGEMLDETRVAINIPVAGHQEEKAIYKSLESYLYQSASYNQFELNLFVNYPETDERGNPLNADATIREIERFKADHPEINIRVMIAALPMSEARISLVRKLLNDAVLLRNAARGKNALELVMVSNDADNTGVAEEYVENFIQKFDQNPDIDAMLGQLDWDPEAYVKYPAIHVGTRLFQYRMIRERRVSSFMASSGANYAFRASTYAAVGGYRPEVADGGEDVILGRAIITARQNQGVVKFAGARVSRLYTSARRAIDALVKKGLSPIEQWSKGFSAFDDAVRKLSMEDAENRNYDLPEDLERLKDEIEYVINRTINVMDRDGGKLAPEAFANYQRLLGYMGILIEDNGAGSVVITDMSKFVKSLRGYQKYGVLQRDAKSGKPGAREAFKAERATVLRKPKK